MKYVRSRSCNIKMSCIFHLTIGQLPSLHGRRSEGPLKITLSQFFALEKKLNQDLKTIDFFRESILLQGQNHTRNIPINIFRRGEVRRRAILQEYIYPCPGMSRYDLHPNLKPASLGDILDSLEGFILLPVHIQPRIIQYWVFSKFREFSTNYFCTFLIKGEKASPLNVSKI